MTVQRQPASRAQRLALAAAVLWAAALPALAQAPAKGNAPAPAQPPAVVVARAEMRDLVQQREFVGRVRALDRVDLRARVEGVLRERRFVEGATVAAGDLLFVIEPDQLEAALDLARSEVAKAEATLVDATSQLQRARELSRNQNIALVDRRLRDVLVARELARALQLLAARASQRQAELALGYTRIVAPVSGRIGEAALTQGNLVNPASGILATIVSQDPIHVSFPVSAR